MMELYNTLLYQPILNLLVYLYNVVPAQEIALAILALTVIVKVLLYPLTAQSLRAQKVMQDLQPKLEALKKQYADNKEKLATETMALYKEQKINPLSSCLPVLIQFPFLIAVYQAFRHGLKSDNLNMLYGFVQNPGTINTMSFGFVDFATPNIILAVLAGGAQFWQTRMLMRKRPVKKTEASKDEDMTAVLNRNMLYFMPVVTIFIGASLPAGLTFYWLITTLLTIAQQVIIFRPKKTKDTGITEVSGTTV